MKVLIIAEHDNHQLKKSTFNTVTAATQLGDDLTLLVVGFECQDVAQQAAKLQGVNKVVVCDNASYQHFLAEGLAPVIAELAQNYDYVLAPASTFGKNILPRVAARLDVAQISDVTKINSKDTFEHPIYAGNAIETVCSLDSVKVLTIRTTAFAACAVIESACSIESIELVIDNNSSHFVKREVSKSDRPELTSASMIVSGGRGLQNKENFKLVEELADVLNAAVGASRAAVDAGFVPNDYQVGQTGKVVAPELYIALGISGAIQHIAGMKDSKVIVAINKDEDAPIFKVANYGLVGDLFELVPEMINELKLTME